MTERPRHPQFHVGDFVVCPFYGVGQVTALDTYAGKPRCLVDFGFDRDAERTPGITPRYYHWHRMAAELEPWGSAAGRLALSGEDSDG